MTNGKRFKLKTIWPDQPKDEVMAIHTGLSVTVAGRVIRLQRCESAKTAEVIVEPVCMLRRNEIGVEVVAPKPQTVLTCIEVEAIKAAANLLHQRATRFLGPDWKVTPWDHRRVEPNAQAG